MTKPLNPSLHRLLEIRFGKVYIVAENQSMIWNVVDRPVASRHKGGDAELRPSRRIQHSGEEYKVSCPFCGDVRQRLFVNHMWGVWDPLTKSRNLFLCQCFNEQCMDDYERRVQLHEQVFAPAPGKREGHMEIGQGKPPAELGEVKPPGPVIPMDQMAVRSPNHPSIRFLEDKMFDPTKLGKVYNVGYCASSRYKLASNRIIIPIYNNGMLAGWQARYIGDPPRKTPKFWSCPGMIRRLLAYNLEIAVRHQTVVVVEGPGDVWGFGPQSTALLGKTMNIALRRRFIAMLRSYEEKYNESQTVVVMTDPEQDPKEKEKGKPHHIDKLVGELNETLRGRAFGIHLPMGSDPGSLDRSFSWDLVRRAGRKHNLPVSFAKPRTA